MVSPPGIALAILLVGPVALGTGLVNGQTPPGDLPPPPGTLERELSLPSDAKDGPGIATGGPSLENPIEIPFLLEGGRIIVDASIDGTPSRPFIFDTGARNIVTPDVAGTLNTSEVRSARLGGVGPATSQADMVKVGQITIGDATITDQVVAVADLPNTFVDRGSRPRVAGLIGSDLLAAYAVTIDYARRILTLNNPGFKPHAAFSLPLSFAISPEGYSLPSVTAELDGVSGDFVIDTGANGEIFLSGTFERENNPFAHYRKVLTLLSPGGLGGPTNVQFGFGEHLNLGPATLTPPVVAGPTDPADFRHSGAGLLGAGILSQFVVTIDYRSGRAYFAPVAGRKLGSVLHGTGMAFYKPDHEGFDVLDVLAGSGAERAGLRPGDRIVEVAGQPARALSVSDVDHLSAFPTHTFSHGSDVRQSPAQPRHRSDVAVRTSTRHA